MRAILLLTGILLACAPPPRATPAPPRPPAPSVATRPPSAPTRPPPPRPDAGTYSGPGTCVARGLPAVEELALDGAQLYVIAGGRVLALSNSGAPRVLAELHPDPHDLLVDGKQLFWLGHESVHAVARSGGPVRTLASAPEEARSYFADLVLLRGRLVWTAPIARRILGVSREAGRLETVAFTPGYRDCASLATDGTQLYAGCADAVVRVLWNRPAHVRLASPSGPVRKLASDGMHLYWIEGGAGRVVKMKPTRTAKLVILAAAQGRIGDLALHASALYWTALDQTQLRGVPTAGGEARVIVSDPRLAGPLAVSPAGVYWGRTGPDCSVARTDLP